MRRGDLVVDRAGYVWIVEWAENGWVGVAADYARRRATLPEADLELYP